MSDKSRIEVLDFLEKNTTNLDKIYNEAINCEYGTRNRNRNYLKALIYYKFLLCCNYKKAEVLSRIAGISLRGGFGVEKDVDESIKYSKLSIKEDPSEPSNYHRIGLIYKDEKKDCKSALEYFKLAIKFNCPYSYYEAGKILFNGFDGVGRNILAAQKYFFEGTKLGDYKCTEAYNYIVQLGYPALYITNKNETITEKQSTKEVETFLEQNKGNFDKIYNEAINCECGTGNKDTNYFKASIYYKYLIKQNYKKAEICRKIAEIFLRGGFGVEENSNEALKYFVLSIKENPNNPAVYYQIGEILIKGNDGVEQNITLAKQYFDNGARLGSKLCKQKLNEIKQSNILAAQKEIPGSAMFQYK